MTEESKKVREHIIEITELKLRRVGGGGEGKRKCWKNAEASIGGVSCIAELLLGSQPEYLCRSLHLSLLTVKQR